MLPNTPSQYNNLRVSSFWQSAVLPFIPLRQQPHRAGGESISLHDKVGIPRRSIISPTWSAQDLRQALGRIHRSGGVSPVIQKILYAGGTVEDRVMAVVRRKLAHLDQITDTDLQL